ncbi:MAG: PKD domain-containing protein [Flavobacteriales bacterium]
MALGGIGEFSIPELVNSITLSDLNTASNLQPFKKIFSNTPNPQGINTITGLKHYDGKLIVNGLHYYNADGSNTHTSVVVETASDLANSSISGFYEMEGACHSAGWISDVPSDLQTALGTAHLAGASSKYAINSRLAQGVTAFKVNPSNFSGSTSTMIPTTPFMDYTAENPLYADYTNYANKHYNITSVDSAHFVGHTKDEIGAVEGINDLWTELSAAEYGFIVPGTRTYLTIGVSGGHFSGIGYKAKQNTGYECGGPCAYDAFDVYNYFWLWDVNDMIAVKNGTKLPHEIRPYSRGEFEVPFQKDLFKDTAEFHPIVGGTYNKQDGLLYLTIFDGGAPVNGAYAKNPVILAYSVGDTTYSDDDIIIVDEEVEIENSVDFGNDTTICFGESLTISVTGQVDSIQSVKWYKNGTQINVYYPSESLTILNASSYSVKVTTINGEEYSDTLQVNYAYCNCNIIPNIEYETSHCVYNFSAPNTTYLTDGFSSMGYLWDFGDGKTSTEANPVHAYDTPGNKIVTLKHYIIDENGECCTREKNISVSIEQECSFSCGVIPSFTNISSPGQTTQQFLSTTFEINGIASYRWTLDDELLTIQKFVNIQNANLTDGQTICLTVFSIDEDGDCCEETICETISVPSSINANKTANPNIDIVLFPNPNSGISQIKVNNFDKNKSYSMTLNDLSGKILKTSTLLKPSTALDLTSFNDGMYILYISDGENTEVLKVIKE